MLIIEIGGASIAGAAFENWTDVCDTAVFRSKLYEIEEYIPGEFYRRELPCILRLLEEHKVSPDIIVVDGFVHLDGKHRPGLGMHLFNALNGEISVIGVAKKPFKGIATKCEVFRGQSQKPLYITSVSIDLEVAKSNIKAMSGKHRVPALLKKADQVCKEI